MDQPIGWAKAVWLWNQATAWAKALWHAIPPKVQGAIVFAAPAAVATLGKLLFDSDHPCWKWMCIRHDLGASVSAGVFALRVFFMRPGPGAHAGESTYAGS
jgi:hypothetical protein